MTGLDPVSYTHLDVYKRQPKDNKMDMSIKIDLDTKNEIVTVTSRLNTDDLDINAMVEKVVNNSKKMDSICLLYTSNI